MSLSTNRSKKLLADLLSKAAIERIGPTEPTYKHPEVIVDEDREDVFKQVARIAMTLNEIWPFGIQLVHRATKKPLSEEWLREYLAKAIHFGYIYEAPEKDGQVPEWLPRMMMKRSRDFTCAMWS